MNGDWFVGCVVVLQSLATVGYLVDGDWRQAIVWLGVAVSNAAWLAVSRS